MAHKHFVRNRSGLGKYALGAVFGVAGILISYLGGVQDGKREVAMKEIDTARKGGYLKVTNKDNSVEVYNYILQDASEGEK